MVVFLLSILFILLSCDELLNNVDDEEELFGNATLNVFNSSNDEYEAVIKGDIITIPTGHTDIIVSVLTEGESLNIYYNSRYAENALKIIAFIEPGDSIPLLLEPNVGWIALTNTCGEKIDYVKMGSQYFKYDEDGKLTDNSSINYTEKKYMKSLSKNTGYIEFYIDTTHMRYTKSVSAILGITMLYTLGPADYEPIRN